MKNSRRLPTVFHHPSGLLSKPKVSGATKSDAGCNLTVPVRSLEWRAPHPGDARPRRGVFRVLPPADYARSWSSPGHTPTNGPTSTTPTKETVDVRRLFGILCRWAP